MHARPRLEAVLWALAALACRPEPLRPVVRDIEFEGFSAVDEKPIRDGLSTAETPLLFGFEGVLEYTTYDRHVLSRDLLRIERYLRARGYYEAKVTATRVVHLGDNRVRVEIEVHEGAPVRVTELDPGTPPNLPTNVSFAINAARRVVLRQIFDEDVFEADKQRVQKLLRDLGYAFAKVQGTARVDVARRSAALSFTIEPGPKSTYGRVTFAGLQEIPEQRVRDTLQIREGDPYSETDIAEARKALVNLGVFSTVDIVPDLSNPKSPTVPIQVRVRESALRTLRVGGGMRFDVLRLLLRFETSWEHRNFLGGMRTFRVDASPGVTLFPTSVERLSAPTRLLPENRVTARLEQPSFLEGRTRGTLNAEYSVAPLLYPLYDLPAEEERIIGYHEISASAGVDRWFFNHRLWIEPSYNWQANYPFTYQRDKPAGLENVRVSFPQLVTVLDLRDDPVRTRNGFYLSNSLQVAGYVFGGPVSDVQVRPEVRAFKTIDRSVLGFRLAFGFLFPGNYGESLQQDGSAELSPGSPEVIEDQQRLNLRAFYSGGPNSNRGYPFRTVGPHGPVGYLAPSNDRECAEFASKDACLRPLGGLTLWEALLEARIPFPVDAPIEGVLFVDASDLTRDVGRIRLNVPHLSPGAGLRYLTPIGPLRLDVGWRVPGAQQLGRRDLSPEEGRPGSDLFGFFPGAVHLVFGTEAF